MAECGSESIRRETTQENLPFYKMNRCKSVVGFSLLSAYYTQIATACVYFDNALFVCFYSFVQQINYILRLTKRNRRLILKF